MPKFIMKSVKKAGSAPGTLIHIGEKRTEQSRIRLLDYDLDQLSEREVQEVKDLFPLRDTPARTWINIDGLHDVDMMERLGQHFGIHPLTLEDIVNTGQRPKMEVFDGYIYIVLKMLYYRADENEVWSEQVSLVFGENWLISFQEAEGDIFEMVRDRIRKGRNRIRKSGSDYLAYALIDAVVDHYFFILEKAGERIESLEEELTGEPGRGMLEAIHALKREMIYMRKQIWPIRELLSFAMKGDSTYIEETSRIYFNDIYDHTIQVIDTVESYRDMLSGMVDLHLSTVSNRMNEVMKVLTIIATIFIPLTFIAGIYGMNFKNMPELDWPWGYAGVWGVMVVVALAMVAYFRRKKWL